MRTTILLTIEPDMKDNVTVDLSLSSHIRRVALKRFLDLGREETGAALVITLAVFLLMYLGIMGVFAASTAMKERIHLQNACDAAAYSAAVVQADTLSRIATINRAMSWTYVDMTRLQMDYIVRHWLGHTYRHYNEDWHGGKDEKGRKHDSLEDYNDNSIPKALGLGLISLPPLYIPHNGPCGQHKGGFGKGYYIGADGTLLTSYMVHLNGRSPLKYRLPKGAGNTRFPNVSSGHNKLIQLVLAELTQADLEYKRKYSVFDLAQQTPQLATDAADIVSMSYDIFSDYDVSAQTRIVLLDNIKQVGDVLLNWNASGSKAEDIAPKFDIAGTVGIPGIPELMKIQIALDKLAIARMNVCIRKLALALPERIDNCVKNIIDANLGNTIYTIDDKQVHYMVNRYKALSNELAGQLPSYLMSFADPDNMGYLRDVFNNVEYENRFLSFSGHNKGILKEFDTGINQWFVRGNGNSRTDGSYGIQRSYKHWADSNQPLARFHATHSPLMPTCWNTEKLEGADPSVALFSEWQWWSDTWFCFDVLTPAGTIHVHLEMPHAWELWPSKATCSHKSKPGILGLKSGKVITPDWSSFFGGSFFKNIAEKAYGDGYKGPSWRHPLGKVKKKNIYYSVPSDYLSQINNLLGSLDDLLGNYERIGSYHDGCSVYPEVFGGIPRGERIFKLTGYSRLYADDPDLYNSSYVGMKAMPLVLDSSYFGKAGTITVGIRRENENVFLRILGAIEGIFKAFDPDWNGSGEKTYSYVFSSAKAGYKNKDDSASLRSYKVDWDETNQAWNLCQSDWDAVFIPVRHAYSYALGIGGVASWVEGEDNMLEDWVASDEWKTLDGDTVDSDESYSSVTAPGGILLGNGHDGVLDWRGLSHVMYH